MQAGHRGRVERGAGTAARYLDADYEQACAKLIDAKAVLGGELVLKVRRPDAAELGHMKPGTVLLATQHYGRIFPMMMTAAGTLKAARVVVLGAGVASLRAIATARRLGAVVEASDVRPYGQVFEMDDINGEVGQTDVVLVLVLGANDVVNPAARNDPNSPIAGMQILEVYKARTVIVNKRSMAAGYTGLDNELFYMDKTMMVFSDAQEVLEDMAKALGS